MSSIISCVGFHLNNFGTIDVPMFVVNTVNYLVLFTIALSWACNIFSIENARTRNNSVTLSSNDWMFWCIFIWQCTNTYILTFIVFFGINKSLLFIFVIHTYLEWFISILYSFHNECKNGDETLGEYIKRQSWVTPLSITVISALSTSHCIQILYDTDLLKIAWTARFGYILDMVGFISSLWFSIKRRDRMAMYCFGAFGGHLLAIIGTFIACILGYNVSVVLMLTSCLQNVSSMLALRHL